MESVALVTEKKPTSKKETNMWANLWAILPSPSLSTQLSDAPQDRLMKGRAQHQPVQGTLLLQELTTLLHSNPVRLGGQISYSLAFQTPPKSPKVARTGVEPALPKELDPKSSASANSAIEPCRQNYIQPRYSRLPLPKLANLITQFDKKPIQSIVTLFQTD